MRAILLIVLGLTACAGASGPTSPISPIGPARAPLACREVPGLADLLAPGSALLLGELHGTEESPVFLADAVCQALELGRRVRVGLEVPAEEGERVTAFLASAGTPAEQATLLAGPFWTDVYQDGRRSQGMAALFETLRSWRAAGHDVRVELLDGVGLAFRPQERDRTMAERLARAHRADPQAVVIALLGNIHTRVTRGTPWSADYEPAGFLLSQLEPALRITALDLSRPAGTAWVCGTAEPSSCGERTVGGSASERPTNSVWLYAEIREGHQGAYRVGSLTASPPATQSVNEKAPPPP